MSCDCGKAGLLLLSQNGECVVNVVGKVLVVRPRFDKPSSESGNWAVEVVNETHEDFGCSETLALTDTKDQALAILEKLAEFLGAIPAGIWMLGRPTQQPTMQQLQQQVQFLQQQLQSLSYVQPTRVPPQQVHLHQTQTPAYLPQYPASAPPPTPPFPYRQG